MKKIFYFIIFVTIFGITKMQAMVCWQRFVFSRTIDKIPKGHAEHLRSHPQYSMRIQVENEPKHITIIQDSGYSVSEIEAQLISKNTIQFNVNDANGYEEDACGFIHRKIYPYTITMYDEELHNAMNNILSHYTDNITIPIKLEKNNRMTRLYKLIKQKEHDAHEPYIVYE
ncbi:MAG TPA: hypothetical protein VGW78_06635 [Candidatus Babeliales bacterium]|jgi:hypothetical protein|nr:hypothetical protein [Candidatus Babeliales bacterium]